MSRHEHDASCAFGNPTCPQFASPKCPICDREAGPYRLGACSPGCDMVMGDDESIIGLLLGLLFAVAVIAVLVMGVRG